MALSPCCGKEELVLQLTFMKINVAAHGSAAKYNYQLLTKKQPNPIYPSLVPRLNVCGKPGYEANIPSNVMKQLKEAETMY